MRKFSMTLLALFLAACSSAPTSENYFYLLHTDTTGPMQTVFEEKWLLERLTLANHLRQPELSIIESNQQIYFANQHRWGEPLEHGVFRSLRNSLRAENIELVLPEEPDAERVSRTISLKIDHFAPTDQGIAVFSGVYWITEDTETSRTPFSYSLPLDQDGFNHSVEKLAELVEVLATRIIQELASS